MHHPDRRKNRLWSLVGGTKPLPPLLGEKKSGRKANGVETSSHIREEPTAKPP